jgi:hypothetical protein
MHRALEIVEIDLICGQYSSNCPDGLSAAASRDLSVLARTSTTFLNPALRILWRQQNTILNLIKCMPDDLWTIIKEEDEEDEPELQIVSRLSSSPNL